MSWSGIVGAVGLIEENGSLVMLEASLMPEAYGESSGCPSSRSTGVRSAVLIPVEAAVLLSLRLRVIGPLLCSRWTCSGEEVFRRSLCCTPAFALCESFRIRLPDLFGDVTGVGVESFAVDILGVDFMFATADSGNSSGAGIARCGG